MTGKERVRKIEIKRYGEDGKGARIGARKRETHRQTEK